MITRRAALAAGIAAAVSLYLGPAVASADPVSPPGPVSWNVAMDGGDVIVHTDAGTLSNEDHHLVVRDAGGNLVDSVPLAIEQNGVEHPVDAAITGDTARLTPDMRPESAVSVLPVFRQADLPAAVASVKDNITLTAAVGGFLGAAAGLVTGCLLGAAVGAAVSAPAALLFGFGPLAGCVGGAVLVGTTSSLTGTAIGGLGAVAANTPQFIELLNAPPKKS